MKNTGPYSVQHVIREYVDEHKNFVLSKLQNVNVFIHV